MSGARARLGFGFSAAVMLAAALVACDDGASGGDQGDASADGAADATVDAPGTDANPPADAGSGDVAADTSTLPDGAPAKDATSDVVTEAAPPSDASGLDVVIDGTDFLDGAGYDGGGGSCNTLANGASLVSQVNVPTARPAATGGNVVDGLYYKTADYAYTGPGGNTGPTGYTVTETLLVTNSSTGTALLTSVFTDGAGKTTTERLAMSPTTGGGATTLTFICPPYGPSPTFYNVHAGDAGETVLDIFISTDRIESFTRQ